MIGQKIVDFLLKHIFDWVSILLGHAAHIYSALVNMGFGDRALVFGLRFWALVIWPTFLLKNLVTLDGVRWLRSILSNHLIKSEWSDSHHRRNCCLLTKNPYQWNKSLVVKPNLKAVVLLTNGCIYITQFIYLHINIQNKIF